MSARARVARLALAGGLAVAAACGRRAPLASGETRVAVTNLTGAEVDAIYVSPHEAPTWEENVLGAERLPDGSTVEIRVAPRPAAGAWDLRVVGGGARYHAEWRRLDLRAIASITLRVDRRAALAELAPVATAGGGAR